MTSYDASVRYEEIHEEFQAQQSGLNLFFVDPSSISSLTLPADACIVAFDLPADLVEYLSKGQVSNPQPLPSLNLDEAWTFVGFDAVDAITQTSAFHGFDGVVLSPENTVEKSLPSLNSHGLIENGQLAIDAALLFDGLFPEHAPFAPCGVWLKRS